MQYIYLSLAIIAEVIATSALKASAGFTNLIPALAVVISYGAAFYFLSLTLRDIPLGVAYAVWAGAGIVLLGAVGWIVFDQKMDFWGIVGMGLSVAGVLVMNLMSKTTAH